jgi:hypothetical protein
LKFEHINKICNSQDFEILENFKIDDEGLYYNERLETEVNRRKDYSESRRKNRLKKDNISKTYVPHMETETETENITINKFNNITPEHQELISIIKLYEKHLKKTYRLSFKERTEICHITNQEQYNLDDWELIFTNAAKGWMINNEKVIPSFTKIFENHSKFLNDDYNLDTTKEKLKIKEESRRKHIEKTNKISQIREPMPEKYKLENLKKNILKD